MSPDLTGSPDIGQPEPASTSRPEQSPSPSDLDWLLATIAEAPDQDAIGRLIEIFHADLKDGHFPEPDAPIAVRWAIRHRRKALNGN